MIGGCFFLYSCVGYKTQLQHEYGLRATEFEKAGEYQQALSYYEKLYQIDRSKDIYLKYLELALDAGDTDRAGELLESMPLSIKKQLTYRELRGYHALKVGQYRVASREYKKLIDKGYSYPRVINNYALSRYYLGDYSAALEAVRALPDDAYNSTAILLVLALCLPEEVENSTKIIADITLDVKQNTKADTTLNTGVNVESTSERESTPTSQSESKQSSSSDIVDMVEEKAPDTHTLQLDKDNDSKVLSKAQETSKAQSTQSIRRVQSTQNTQNTAERTKKPTRLPICDTISLEEYISKSILLSKARVLGMLSNKQYLYIDRALERHQEHADDLRLSFLDAFIEAVEQDYTIPHMESKTSFSDTIVSDTESKTDLGDAQDIESSTNQEEASELATRSIPNEETGEVADGDIAPVITEEKDEITDVTLLSDDAELEFAYYYSLFSATIIHLRMDSPLTGNPRISELIASLRQSIRYGILDSSVSDVAYASEKLKGEFDELIEISQGRSVQEELIALRKEVKSRASEAEPAQDDESKDKNEKNNDKVGSDETKNSTDELSSAGSDEAI